MLTLVSCTSTCLNTRPEKNSLHKKKSHRIAQAGAHKATSDRSYTRHWHSTETGCRSFGSRGLKCQRWPSIHSVRVGGGGAFTTSAHVVATSVVASWLYADIRVSVAFDNPVIVVRRLNVLFPNLLGKQGAAANRKSDHESQRKGATWILREKGKVVLRETPDNPQRRSRAHFPFSSAKYTTLK